MSTVCVRLPDSADASASEVAAALRDEGIFAFSNGYGSNELWAHADETPESVLRACVVGLSVASENEKLSKKLEQAEDDIDDLKADLADARENYDKLLSRCLRAETDLENAKDEIAALEQAKKVRPIRRTT